MIVMIWPWPPAEFCKLPKLSIKRIRILGKDAVLFPNAQGVSNHLSFTFEAKLSVLITNIEHLKWNFSFTSKFSPCVGLWCRSSPSDALARLRQCRLGRHSATASLALTSVRERCSLSPHSANTHSNIPLHIWCSYLFITMMLSVFQECRHKCMGSGPDAVTVYMWGTETHGRRYVRIQLICLLLSQPVIWTSANSWHSISFMYSCSWPFRSLY